MANINLAEDQNNTSAQDQEATTPSNVIRLDTRRAGAKAKEAGYSLKAWSSSRTASAIRHSFLLPGNWGGNIP